MDRYNIIKGILFEYKYDGPTINKTSYSNTNPDKKEFDFSRMVFNDDGKINRGYNKVFIDGVRICTFVIRNTGKMTFAGKVYKNSIYFEGGFIVVKEYQKNGIGREVIKKIFRDNSNVENIFLKAIDWQGAVGFWLKIGGIIIWENPENGLKLFQLNRNNIK